MLQDARVPFFIADIVVILALYFADKGLKAEKALRELQAEHEVQQAKEVGKDTKRAQKAVVRNEQKHNKKTQKQPKNGKHNNQTHNIQQPSKKSS